MKCILCSKQCNIKEENQWLINRCYNLFDLPNIFDEYRKRNIKKSTIKASIKELERKIKTLSTYSKTHKRKGLEEKLEKYRKRYSKNEDRIIELKTTIKTYCRTTEDICKILGVNGKKLYSNPLRKCLGFSPPDKWKHHRLLEVIYTMEKEVKNLK